MVTNHTNLSIRAVTEEASEEFAYVVFIEAAVVVGIKQSDV